MPIDRMREAMMITLCDEFQPFMMGVGKPVLLFADWLRGRWLREGREPEWDEKENKRANGTFAKVKVAVRALGLLMISWQGLLSFDDLAEWLLASEEPIEIEEYRELATLGVRISLNGGSEEVYRELWVAAVEFGAKRLNRKD